MFPLWERFTFNMQIGLNIWKMEPKQKIPSKNVGCRGYERPLDILKL